NLGLDGRLLARRERCVVGTVELPVEPGYRGEALRLPHQLRWPRQLEPDRRRSKSGNGERHLTHSAERYDDGREWPPPHIPLDRVLRDLDATDRDDADRGLQRVLAGRLVERRRRDQRAHARSRRADRDQDGDERHGRGRRHQIHRTEPDNDYTELRADGSDIY